MRIIHLPFGWRNLGNKYFGVVSFWQGQRQALMKETRVLNFEELTLKQGKQMQWVIHSFNSSLLSTYWVQGIVLDGVDRVVSALLELTCQWGKSDNEQVNKYAIFCLAVKDNQDTQEAKSEKMKSLKSVWEDLSRDLYNVGERCSIESGGKIQTQETAGGKALGMECSGRGGGLFAYSVSKFILFDVDHLKVFTEFVIILLLFYVLRFFVFFF